MKSVDWDDGLDAYFNRVYDDYVEECEGMAHALVNASENEISECRKQKAAEMVAKCIGYVYQS